MIILIKKLLYKLTLISLCVFYSVTWLSAEEQKYLLDQKTHTVLSECHQYIEDGKNADAIKKLKQLLVSDKIKDYDAAVVYQTLGFAEYNIGNFTISADNFIKALSFKALPKDVTHQLNYSTSEILLQIDKPKEALQYLSKWFTDEATPNAEAHILAATINYKIKNYKEMVAHAEKALSLSDDPPLNWYELLLTGYYEAKSYKKAASLVEKIISKDPQKTNYWLHLAEIYQRMKQDKKALAIYELAYTKKILKPDDVLRLINNYLYLDMPYKAAVILEKEINNGDIQPDKKMLTLLADSWLLAHENERVKTVYKEILKKFNDDSTRLRLGQLYIQTKEWDKTIEVLDVKFNTDDNTFISKAKLLLGIAQFHAKELLKATQAFTHALSDQSTKEQANWWLNHIKNMPTDTQDS
jgi:tetratricopeptide (TPR) repeat protein